MSLNTAHASGGVLIHAGECILLYCEQVIIEFHGQEAHAFRGTKTGKLYLTTHRLIFNNKDVRDQMISFSFPFCTLSEVELEQPVFGANYIKGKVRAQPNGNWVGEAKFKILFKKGGAIDFGQAMVKVAQLSKSNSGGMFDAPPPYAPPPGPWYEAPPPVYTPAPGGFGWVPTLTAFPDPPPANTVYMTDMPPPYPGISGYNGYATAPPSEAMGFSGPMGFSQPQPPVNNPKAAEAAQSAYYDPNKPQCAYVPPPSYYEPPPAYQMNGDKKSQ